MFDQDGNEICVIDYYLFRNEVLNFLMTDVYYNFPRTILVGKILQKYGNGEYLVEIMGYYYKSDAKKFNITGERYSPEQIKKRKVTCYIPMKYLYSWENHPF